MTDLVTMLRSRRDDAKHRMEIANSEAEQAHKKAAQAEDEWRKWEDALAIELRNTDSREIDINSSNGNGHHQIQPYAASAWLQQARQAAANSRIKHMKLRNFLMHAGVALKPNELIELLKDELSERYVWMLIAQWKKSGELIESEDGGLRLLQ